MTKLEELNRKMLDIEKRAILSEEQYATYKQLLEAVEALNYINALCECPDMEWQSLNDAVMSNKVLLEKLK